MPCPPDLLGSYRRLAQCWTQSSQRAGVLIGSTAHSASYLTGTAYSFPGHVVNLTTNLHQVPKLRMTGATTPFHHSPSWRTVRQFACGASLLGCETVWFGIAFVVLTAVTVNPCGVIITYRCKKISQPDAAISQVYYLTFM
jgi:hypothetical protein